MTESATPPKDHAGQSDTDLGRERDTGTESEPTESGRSTADSQEQRNREDESPG